MKPWTAASDLVRYVHVEQPLNLMPGSVAYNSTATPATHFCPHSHNLLPHRRKRGSQVAEANCPVRFLAAFQVNSSHEGAMVNTFPKLGHHQYNRNYAEENLYGVQTTLKSDLLHPINRLNPSDYYVYHPL
jgi:hypothetical protein